ncbi:unnamed protein product, partial [marine sediment metagenome]
GRNEIDNNILLQLKEPDDLIMEVEDISGPITIIQGEINEDSLKFAASLTLRYSDSKDSIGKVMYGNDYQNLTKSIIAEKEDNEISKVYLL